MKLTYIFVAAILCSLCGCTKTTTQTIVVTTPVASYSVDGIQDMVLNINNINFLSATLPLTLSYHDSTQEKVTVAISGVPTSIYYSYMNSKGPWIGVPTFSLPIYFSTNSAGLTTYNAGTYPVTLTCTSAQSGTKIFTFNLILE